MNKNNPNVRLMALHQELLICRYSTGYNYWLPLCCGNNITKNKFYKGSLASFTMGKTLMQQNHTLLTYLLPLLYLYQYQKINPGKGSSKSSYWFIQITKNTQNMNSVALYQERLVHIYSTS